MNERLLHMVQLRAFRHRNDTNIKLIPDERCGCGCENDAGSKATLSDAQF